MYRFIVQLLVISWLCFSMSLSAWGTENQNWKIKIRVDGSTTYGYVVAGVRDTATDSNDLAWDVQARLDNLNADANDPFIYVYFPHPEYSSPIVYSPHPELGLNLSECVKDPLLPKEWVFKIDSNINGPLTITWPNLAATLPGYEVSITDLDGAGAQIINMQETSAFSFDNTAGVPRQFQLKIGGPSVADPYFLSAITKNKIVQLNWDLATEEDARQYTVLRKIDDGPFEELQSLGIAENQFTDKLGKEIVRSSEQTQLTYKIATVNAAGGVIHSSIEVSVF